MLVCRSNIKSLTLGAFLWSEAHDDWAIAGDWWKEEGENDKVESAMGPYLDASSGAKGKEKGVFACPSTAQAEFLHVDPDYETDEKRFTYAVNGYIALNMTANQQGSPGTSGPATGTIYGPPLKPSLYWSEHGVTKMANIRMPTDTVYFIDHEYYVAMSWTFNPHKALDDFLPTYKYATRWHKKKPDRDYGVGNIGWVDGHVTVEPSNFTDKKETSGGRTKYKWKYYFYEH